MLPPKERLGETAVLACSGLNYIRIALTLVVFEHSARNVRFTLPDIEIYLTEFCFMHFIKLSK